MVRARAAEEDIHHPGKVMDTDYNPPARSKEEISPKEGDEEGSTEDNSASPSLSTGTTDLHRLNDKKKQTAIDTFLCSAKEKLLQTKEVELNRSNKRTPVRNVKKTPTVKESGKKRKKEMQSSGNIEKYFTRRQNSNKDDIKSGEGGFNNNVDNSNIGREVPMMMTR